MQPCRNGAVARRGRGKRRPVLLPSLRDANAKVRFSVGNDFSAHTRKAFRTNAVGGASRKRIAANPLLLWLVPGAYAPKSQPVRYGTPNGDDVKNEASRNV